MDNVMQLACTKGSYAYAFRGVDGVTLIDTSLPGRGEAILAELAEQGIAASDIARILLTHHDVDHVGNAALLQERTGATVYIGAADYPYLMEGRPRDGIKRLIGSVMRVQRPATVQTVTGGTIGDITVRPTPGHTPGHMAYEWGGVLFLGDLVHTHDGRVSPTPRLLTWNAVVLAESLRTLSVAGIDWLCPAHGDPVPAAAWADFRRTYAG